MTEMRVFYSKTGDMKFISHLDTIRLMARAIKKASIPIWFTEGFNPHPYMTFSMPLSLGHESYCESFDIRLTEEIDLSSAVESLNKALPEGFKIQKICTPRFKPSDITEAKYRITFFGVNKTFAEKLEAFLARESITVQKTGKKGKISEIDLKTKIRDAKISFAGDKAVLELYLPSGTTENINPALLISAFSDTVLEMPCLDILRVELLCKEAEFC